MPKCIVLPGSVFRVIWDVASAMFLVYLMAALPVVIGMDLNIDFGGPMHVIDLLMDTVNPKAASKSTVVFLYELAC